MGVKGGDRYAEADGKRHSEWLQMQNAENWEFLIPRAEKLLFAWRMSGFWILIAKQNFDSPGASMRVYFCIPDVQSLY